MSRSKNKLSDASPSSQPRRWSSRRKSEVVIRLLRGESLDAVAREIGQPVTKLAEWRESFLRGGEAAMKSRSDDPVVEEFERERKELRAKLGEVLMDKELLEEKIRRMEDGVPFPRRRSKR